MYCWIQILVWVAIWTLQTASSSPVMTERFGETLIPAWTPMHTFANTRSIIECSLKCDNPKTPCNVWRYVKSTKTCFIAHFSTFGLGELDTPTFIKQSAYPTITITIRVLDASDNQAIPFMEVRLSQGSRNISTGLTDAQGQVEIQVFQLKSTIIQASGPGYLEVIANITTGPFTQDSVVLSTSKALPVGTFRGIMTWDCCVDDVDLSSTIFGHSYAPICKAWFAEPTCNRPPGGTVTLEIDAFGYGLEGGETLKFEGEFELGDTNLIYVEIFSYEDVLGSAGISFTLYGHEGKVTVESPISSVNATYWIVGCFRPSLGLSSFQTINTYDFTLVQGMCS